MKGFLFGTNQLSRTGSPVKAGILVLFYMLIAILWFVFPDFAGLISGETPKTVEMPLFSSDGFFIFVTGLALFVALNHLQNAFAAEKTAKDNALAILDIISEQSNDALFIRDRDGRFQMLNHEASRLTGLEETESLGVNARNTLPSDQAESSWRMDMALMQEERSVTYEEVLTTIIGPRIFRTTKGPIHDENHRVIGLFGISRDITEQKEAEKALSQSQAQHRLLFNNLLSGIVYGSLIHENGKPVDCLCLAANARFSRLIGFEDPVGNRLISILSPMAESDEDLLARFTRVAESGGYEQFEIYAPARDKWFDIALFSPEHDHVALILDDISERRKAQELIALHAYRDPLTGLPNRRLAERTACQAMEEIDRSGGFVAFLLLGIDNFQPINDAIGYLFGDALIQRVAERLCAGIGEKGNVARHEGDEFLIVSVPMDSPENATLLAEEILDRLKEPFEIDGQTVQISASIGIALYPCDGVNFNMLLRHADSALLRAKDAGRNTCFFFERASYPDVDERFKLHRDMRAALEQDQFVLRYQPKVNIETGEIVAAEALLYWRHPELGIVEPERFISLAEKNGLIVPIGTWVLRESCRRAVSWTKKGLPDLSVAVNLSAIQLRRDGLEKTVALILDETGLDPARLELEITESLLVKDSVALLDLLGRLKALGVAIAIDDFGTGYCSLSYLKQFTLDTLKIDQSFVIDMMRDSRSMAIVRAIFQMAEGFKLKTIAEGVEDRDTLDCLREMGCKEAQGYYFSPPLDVAAFEDYVAASRLSVPLPDEHPAAESVSS